MELPNRAKLELNKGDFVEIPVEFEWVPPICSKCKYFGHKEEHCPIISVEKWVPKQVINIEANKEGIDAARSHP